MESAPASGSTWLTPFAFFDRDSCSWRTCQGSLLEDSAESCTTWPRQGTWDLGFAYELPMLALPTDETASSFLLPTPVARDDGKSPEAHRQMKANLRGGPRTRITSLAVLARADFVQPDEPLLPTPTGQDAENDGGPSQFDRNTVPLNARVKLLPTPGANDATGAEKETREARREKGTGGPSLRDLPKLLPTPQASDGDGGRVDRNPETLRTGKRPSGSKASVPLATALDRLLPTPVANPDNPGAGGELGAALTHGPGRRNETGTDTMGRPNTGRPSRLLPTPTVQDHKQNALNEAEAERNPHTMWATMHRIQHGGRTREPFDDGSRSSDEQHPGQLTLEDASTLDSSSGCSDSPTAGSTSTE